MKVVEELTESTIEKIQGKFPRCIESDKSQLRADLNSGEIFENMSGEWRQSLFDRLCELKIMIPSFYTFFEDRKVLEEYSQCMRHLVELREGDTITSALRNAFVSQTESFTQAYRRLFLFARLRFQDMPVEPRRKASRLLAKIRPGVAKQTVLYEFGKYATEIGFSNAKINKLIQDNQTKSPEPFSVSPQEAYSGVVRAAPRSRCGFPDTASFEVDKRHFTFENIEQLPLSVENFKSTHALRSAFCSFFIPPDSLDSTLSNSNKAPTLNTEEITVDKVVPSNKALAIDMEISEDDRRFPRPRKRQRNSLTSDENITCFFPEYCESTGEKLREIEPCRFKISRNNVEDDLRKVKPNLEEYTLYQATYTHNQLQLHSIVVDRVVQAADESPKNTVIIVSKNACIDKELREICAFEVYNAPLEL